MDEAPRNCAALEDRPSHWMQTASRREVAFEEATPSPWQQLLRRGSAVLEVTSGQTSWKSKRFGPERGALSGHTVPTAHVLTPCAPRHTSFLCLDSPPGDKSSRILVCVF